MYLTIFLLISCVFIIANAENGVTSVRFGSGPTHHKVVMCSALIEPQFPMNLFYNFVGLSQFDKLNLEMCTHLNFVDFELSRLKEPWTKQTVQMDYERAKLLRKKYPHLKILLGVFRNKENLLALTSPASREKFIKFMVDSILKHELDGLNLMWEDNGNSVDLLKEMFESFKPHQLLLSASLPMDRKYSLGKFDYGSMAKYVNFMQIFNTDSVYNAMQSGVPVAKIIFGITTVATPVADSFVDLFDLSAYQYSLRYDEICHLLLTCKVLSKTFDSDAQKMVVKYIDEENVTRTLKFESTRTVANKTRFAVIHNLRGVGLYLADGDDKFGKCPIEQDSFIDFKPPVGITLNIPTRRNNSFALLRTMHEAILITLDELRQYNDIIINNNNRLVNRQNHANANVNVSSANSFDWTPLLSMLGVE